MGLRFRKSFKLAPGIRINLSKGGASWTLGPRGASIGIGKRGAYLNTGFPGTGLSSRQQLSSSSGRKKGVIQDKQTINVSMNLSVGNDGQLRFLDSAGNSVAESLIVAAKKQKKEAILKLLTDKCEEISSGFEELARLHVHTPNPMKRPEFLAEVFKEDTPLLPIEKKLGFLGSMFKSIRRKIEDLNSKQQAEFTINLQNWNVAKEKFEKSEIQRRVLIEEGIYKDISSMESFLELTLSDIVWPRETEVSFELFDSGKGIVVDIDLPEIEDMPQEVPVVRQRELCIDFKEISPTKVQRTYMAHVHSIGFRVIGEIFAALPLVEVAILSGYSQRPSSSTGHISDEYLYSVKVRRETWQKLNFASLVDLDIVEAFTQFELRRKMTKTGKFSAIEPFELEGSKRH